MTATKTPKPVFRQHLFVECPNRCRAELHCHVCGLEPGGVVHDSDQPY